jgi:8-oxo-dGTP pyrophosphatase MutT (NUDIX family)
LFQQRSANKDTNPGCFDITAAGHLEAGETPRAVVRELDEELGVSVDFEQLREYGIIREEGSGVVGGVRYIDAEMSHVYGLVTAAPLADFRLQEEEVSGLYEADADELISLMEGSREEVTAQGVELRSGKLQASETVVTRSSFVFRDYEYYISVFKFLRGLVQER